MVRRRRQVTLNSVLQEVTRTADNRVDGVPDLPRLPDALPSRRTARSYRCFSCAAEIIFCKCHRCEYDQAIPSRWFGAFTCGRCDTKVDIPRQRLYSTSVKAQFVRGYGTRTRASEDPRSADLLHPSRPLVPAKQGPPAPERPRRAAETVGRLRARGGRPPWGPGGSSRSPQSRPRSRCSLHARGGPGAGRGGGGGGRRPPPRPPSTWS